MNSKFIFIIASLARGKTLVRSLMNWELTQYTLSGRILDIGGGEDPSYFRFFRRAADAAVTTVDIEGGSKQATQLDLEKSSLPFEDNSFDTILLFNFLEHVYNYANVLTESQRVLVENGRLIGFVPFLVNVHPDPHDYFRYTGEAIARMFADANLTVEKIEPIGYGPFAVSFNTIAQQLPSIVSVVLFPCCMLFDAVILRMRPKWRERFPLGYFFEAVK